MAGPTGEAQDKQKRSKEALGANVDADKLKAKVYVSHFGANAVLRGMQLTLVGGM